MAALDRHRAADVDIEPFPEIEAQIGENPARWLDRDLVNRGPRHTTRTDHDLFLARVRGIGKIGVANAYIRVERELAERDDREPRKRVIDLLRSRIEYLVENGETHLPGRSREELRALNEDLVDDHLDEEDVDPVWRHDKDECGSTDVERESSRTWFCNACQQRTNRVVEVDPEIVAADGGQQDG